MRWFVPFLLIGAAVYVAQYNSTHQDGVIVIAFLDLVPGIGSDPNTLGTRSWQLLLVLGVASLGLRIMANKKEAPQEEP
jgi:hypothetical protein